MLKIETIIIRKFTEKTEKKEQKLRKSKKLLKINITTLKCSGK